MIAISLSSSLYARMTASFPLRYCLDTVEFGASWPFSRSEMNSRPRKTSNPSSLSESEISSMSVYCCGY
jgi:hypothetical protein